MVTGIIIVGITSLLKALVLLGIVLLLTKLFKIKIKRKVKNALLIMFFATAIVANLEIYVPIVPYIDTKFAQGFTLQQYKIISKGMTRSEVESLIGSGFPTHYSMLTDTANNEKTCVLYSQDKEIFIYDFAWVGLNVCYDNNNQVTRIAESIVRN